MDIIISLIVAVVIFVLLALVDPLKPMHRPSQPRALDILTTTKDGK